MMTKQEAREAALDEYHAAINVKEITPAAKERVAAALKALGPFLENGKVPLDLKKRFEAK